MRLVWTPIESPRPRTVSLVSEEKGLCAGLEALRMFDVRDIDTGKIHLAVISELTIRRDA